MSKSIVNNLLKTSVKEDIFKKIKKEKGTAYEVSFAELENSDTSFEKRSLIFYTDGKYYISSIDFDESGICFDKENMMEVENEELKELNILLSNQYLFDEEDIQDTSYNFVILSEKEYETEYDDLELFKYKKLEVDNKKYYLMKTGKIDEDSVNFYMKKDKFGERVSANSAYNQKILYRNSKINENYMLLSVEENDEKEIENEIEVLDNLDVSKIINLFKNEEKQITGNMLEYLEIAQSGENSEIIQFKDKKVFVNGEQIKDLSLFIEDENSYSNSNTWKNEMRSSLKNIYGRHPRYYEDHFISDEEKEKSFIYYELINKYGNTPKETDKYVAEIISNYRLIKKSLQDEDKCVGESISFSDIYNKYKSLQRAGKLRPSEYPALDTAFNSDVLSGNIKFDNYKQLEITKNFSKMKKKHEKDILLEMYKDKNFSDILASNKFKDIRRMTNVLQSKNVDEKIIDGLILDYHNSLNKKRKSHEVKIETENENMINKYISYKLFDKEDKLKTLLDLQIELKEGEEKLFYSDYKYKTTFFNEEGIVGINMLIKDTNTFITTKGQAVVFESIKNELINHIQNDKNFEDFIENKYDKLFEGKVLLDINKESGQVNPNMSNRRVKKEIDGNIRNDKWIDKKTLATYIKDEDKYVFTYKDLALNKYRTFELTEDDGKYNAKEIRRDDNKKVLNVLNFENSENKQSIFIKASEFEELITNKNNKSLEVIEDVKKRTNDILIKYTDKVSKTKKPERGINYNSFKLSRREALEGLSDGKVLVINSNKNDYSEDKIRMIKALPDGRFAELEISKREYVFFDNLKEDTTKFNFSTKILDEDGRNFIFDNCFGSRDIQALVEVSEVNTFWSKDTNNLITEGSAFNSSIQNVVNSTRGIKEERDIVESKAILAYKANENRDIYIFLENDNEESKDGIVNMRYLALDTDGASYFKEIENVCYKEGKFTISDETMMIDENLDDENSIELTENRERCEEFLSCLNRSLDAHDREIRNNELLIKDLTSGTNKATDLSRIAYNLEKSNLPGDLRTSILRIRESNKHIGELEYLNTMFRDKTEDGNAFIDYLKYKSEMGNLKISAENKAFCQKLEEFAEEDTIPRALIKMGIPENETENILSSINETFKKELFLIKNSRNEKQINVISHAINYEEVKDKSFNNGVFDINKIYPDFKKDLMNKELNEKIEKEEESLKDTMTGPFSINTDLWVEQSLNDSVHATFYNLYKELDNSKDTAENKRLKEFSNYYMTVLSYEPNSEGKIVREKDAMFHTEETTFDELIKKDWEDMKTWQKEFSLNYMLSEVEQYFPYGSIKMKPIEVFPDRIENEVHVKLKDRVLIANVLSVGEYENGGITFDSSASFETVYIDNYSEPKDLIPCEKALIEEFMREDDFWSKDVEYGRTVESFYKEHTGLDLGVDERLKVLEEIKREKEASKINVIEKGNKNNEEELEKEIETKNEFQSDNDISL